MSLTSYPAIANLKRWIKASFLQELPKHLTGGPVFAEGDDRLTSQDATHYEVRIDGPYLKPCGTRNEFRTYIEVNILANSTRNESNAFARETLQGIITYALMRDFCIYRIGAKGTIAEDDESLVGVMQFIAAEQLKLSDFGQIDIPEVYQAVGEAHYEMYSTLE